MFYIIANRVVLVVNGGFEFAKHETSNFGFGFDFFTADDINTLQKHPNVHPVANILTNILMNKMNTRTDKVTYAKYKNELLRFNSWESYMLDNGFTINISIL